MYHVSREGKKLKQPTITSIKTLNQHPGQTNRSIKIFRLWVNHAKEKEKYEFTQFLSGCGGSGSWGPTNVVLVNRDSV